MRENAVRHDRRKPRNAEHRDGLAAGGSRGEPASGAAVAFNIRWDTFDAIMQTGFLADTIATDGSTTSHAREQPRHPEPADPCGRPDRAMAYPGGRPHADGSPHPLGRRGRHGPSGAGERAALRPGRRAAEPPEYRDAVPVDLVCIGGRTANLEWYERLAVKRATGAGRWSSVP